MKEDMVWTISLGIFFGMVIGFWLIHCEPASYLIGMIMGAYVWDSFRLWMRYLKAFVV